MPCFVFAAWCVACVWLPLEALRGYPGILSFSGVRGVYELIELPTGLPASALLAAWGVASFLLAMAVHVLARWMDADRRARDAVRWAFGSRSLNLGACALASSAALLSFTPEPFKNAIGTFATTVVMASGLALPFFAWHPATLTGPRLVRWWRPKWPGVPVVLVAIVVTALGLSTDFALEMGAQAGWPGWVNFLLRSVDWIGFTALWLMVAIAWIGSGSSLPMRRRLHRVLRRRGFANLLWQCLLGLLAALAVAIPIAVVAALLIFAVPQYMEWEQARGHAPSWLLRAGSALPGDRAGILAIAVVPGVMYWSFAQARLLFVLDRRAEPDQAIDEAWR